MSDLLGERIRRHRLRLGLSQQQLAERCGVTQASICGWEKGLQFPSSKHHEMLCRMLSDPKLFENLTGVAQGGRLLNLEDMNYLTAVVSVTGVPLPLDFLLGLLDQRQQKKEEYEEKPK